MRWGKKYDLNKRMTRKRFYLFPRSLKGEWRWLETVTEVGYYWRGGFTGTLYWELEDWQD